KMVIAQMLRAVFVCGVSLRSGGLTTNAVLACFADMYNLYVQLSRTVGIFAVSGFHVLRYYYYVIVFCGHPVTPFRVTPRCACHLLQNEIRLYISNNRAIL